MFIKEVVIEGFKSYAHRTVIDGFDCNFNAITGLNGSGKSNILDAICFVLGLSALSLVRVTNLQELIYKNGQAGVTKASVSILFDNTEKRQSPDVYKRYDQITVRREISLTGTSKYSINGTKVTAEKVKEFFMFVGLNVNNANFLIMQGRITQVINMKPREILSLVEETAGTNVYEATKRKAQLHMDKKQRKLGEIDEILLNELEPKLAKLKEEQKCFYEYKDLEEALRIHEMKFRTLSYLSNAKDISRKVSEGESTMASLIAWQGRVSRKEQKAFQLEDELKKLVDTDSTEEDKQLEKDLKDLKTQNLKTKSDLETFEGQLRSYREEIAGLEKQINNHKASVSSCSTELEAVELTSASLASRLEEKVSELGSLKAKLSALQQGLEVEADDSLQLSIERTKQEQIRVNQSMRQVQQQISMQEKELSEKTHRLRNAERELKEGSEEAKTVEFNLTSLQDELRRLPEEPDMQEAKSHLAKLEAKRGACAQELAKFNLGRYALEYRDPTPGFDRSGVFGRVIRLVKLKELKYAQAIEAMVSNLYSVVVKDDVIGATLLKSKVLGNVKLLPLNTLHPRELPRHKTEEIGRKFSGQARLGIELVEYEQVYQVVMKFVFGSFYVCESREVARAVCYEHGFTCVTTQGEVYEPSGCLSGGGQPSSSNPFQEIARVEELENIIRAIKSEQTELTRRISSSEQNKQQRQACEQKIQQCASKLKQIKAIYGDNSVEDLEQQMVVVRDKIETLRSNSAQLQESLVDLERELAGKISQAEQANKRGANQAQQLERRYSDLQKEHASVEAKLKTAQMKVSQIAARIASSNKEAERSAEMIRVREATFSSKQKEIERLREELASKVAQHDAQKSDLDSRHQRSAQTRAETEQLSLEISKRRDQIKMCQGEINKIGSKIGGLDSEVKQLNSTNVIMMEQYPWLSHQLKFAGSAEYDPNRYNLEVEGAKLDDLIAEVRLKGRKVNLKVSATLEESINRFQSLTQNRQAVMDDKEKIEGVIMELDEKKNADIQTTWEQIGRNFSDIFATLLPGAEAKLAKVDTGLEMLVGFNGVWKKNLGELSGGQRSLLALSFILASLKYKPAPLYILDEIDAALDLSHTQNIGSMLRLHFSQSQFIVVSLKEGMFTNANVLYRTQFIEGRSTIERRALRENSADQERQRKSRAYR
jgi:structural maintenance of chromosome 2